MEDWGEECNAGKSSRKNEISSGRTIRVIHGGARKIWQYVIWGKRVFSEKERKRLGFGLKKGLPFTSEQGEETSQKDREVGR